MNKFANLRNLDMQRMIISCSKRSFGPKAAKPAAGAPAKGGAQGATPAADATPIVTKTLVEKLIESG